MAAKKGGVDSGRLKSLIERIEKLEEERRTIGEDVKEVFSEAKAAGYDARIIRRVIALRRMDRADRQEQEELVQLYLSAVGE
jgi:uncharacterized protein (UPF0335 family)